MLMKKLLLLTMLCVAFSVIASAQSAIVPVGGTAAGAGGSATYTVGQIAVQRQEGNGKYIIEGVQQPYEIQTVGIDDYPDITLEAIVYPNPTQHSVQLRISNYTIPDYGLTAQLYDANGRLLQVYTVSDFETKIDMENYPTATYQLRVLNAKRLLKTFKIVKHNF